MEIQLCPAKVLHALAAFADPKDIRAYVRGVWVENSRAGLILYATNGSALAALRVGDMAPCESFDEMIPPHAIAQMPKNAHPAIWTRDVDGKCALTVVNLKATWAPEGVNAPPWRRVVPAEVDRQPAQFDGALLAKFANLALALGRKKEVAGWLRVSHNGPGIARVHLPDHPEVVGVLNPLRDHATALADDTPFTPDWALQATPDDSLV